MVRARFTIEEVQAAALQIVERAGAARRSVLWPPTGANDWLPWPT